MQERKLVPVEQLSSEYKNINKWAVIVGISEYKHKPWKLNYAHRDAEELFKLLQTKTGGDFKKENIAYLIDKQATTTNIRIALFDFLQKPAKEDLVFIFFACHGTPDPSRPQNLYLLTYDTDPESIPGTGLPMEDIYRSLNNTLLAEKIIVMADTCHSGGLSQNSTRSVEDDSELLNQYFENLSQSVGGVASLTSAEAREVSREGEQWGGGHGVFTHHVLEGMKGAADVNNDGIVSVGELFEYVRERVKEDTDHRQHPSIGSGGFDRNLPIAVISGKLPNPQPSPNIEPKNFPEPDKTKKNTKNLKIVMASLIPTTIVLVLSFLAIRTPKIPDVDNPELPFDLKSERGIDYSELGNMLSTDSWEEANSLTSQLVLQSVDKTEQGYLTAKDTQNIPCEDLITIDGLWEFYSDNRFGFTEQANIWDIFSELQAKSSENNYLAAKSFEKIVGWDRDIDLQSDISQIPKGHFPFRPVYPNGLAEASGGDWIRTMSSRIDRCYAGEDNLAIAKTDISSLKNYTITIHYLNRDSQLIQEAQLIQNKLVQYGFTPEQVRSRGLSQGWFNSSGGLSSNQIRYERDIEDEEAEVLQEVLSEVYPVREFNLQTIKGNSPNSISIFLK
ncbi:MAG: GUN4 domain-containing protein [Cyanobacteria bacterium P01_A01_bin.40]